MKKLNLYKIFLVFAIAGCSNITNTTPKQTLGEKLESEKDLISTIETYNAVYKNCKCPISESFADEYCEMTRSREKSYICHQCRTAYQESDFDWKDCDTSLRIQNIKYKCFEKFGYQSGYKDKTDECILYRREVKESSINFFDFERFIPEGTKIKTEQGFKGLAKAYENGIYKCNQEKEITTQERANCFDNVKNEILKLAYDPKVKCTDLEILKTGYLTSRLSMLCSCDSKNKKGYTVSPENIDKLKQEIKNYSDSFLCDISDWEKEFVKYCK